MDTEIRQRYNQQFTQEKYRAFLDEISNAFQYQPPFRIAETPVFVPPILKQRLEEACIGINEFICQPNFKELTQDAIKHPSLQVPKEDYHSRFLQMDFAICHDEQGELIPQLIELQGFPSLYFFQDLIAKSYRKHFDIPAYMVSHLNGMDSAAYLALLKEIIVGEVDPKEVILLEVEPEKQNTYIDFLGAEHHLGIKVLCISKLKKRGKQLYYLDENGKEIQVKRIYNRVIFDELFQRTDLKREFYFHDEVEVEWVGHPHWYFRISKYTMPLLRNKYVPPCFYLNQLEKYPNDLENYVLKPLYSFSGSGIQLDVTVEELDGIEDRENYILQRKVTYEPVIPTPSGPAKCEIRMLMLWVQGESRARIVNNLVRLTKGAMVGVKYNKDKDWVGASVGFFKG